LKSEVSAKSRKGCDGVHTYTYPSKYQLDPNQWSKVNLVEHFIFWRDLKEAGYVKKEEPIIQDLDQDQDLPSEIIVNPEQLPINSNPEKRSIL
jgi:hypothetical protein